ncbi:MAG: hypothetical protein VYE22_26105 [Myxococcota bacterium]|nr:hypothetical protein [Myxococcota bacterium]
MTTSVPGRDVSVLVVAGAAIVALLVVLGVCLVPPGPTRSELAVEQLERGCLELVVHSPADCALGPDLAESGDLWGNEVRVDCAGPYTLSSAGPDGQLGTDDDIAASCACRGAGEAEGAP